MRTLRNPICRPRHLEQLGGDGAINELMQLNYKRHCRLMTRTWTDANGAFSVSVTPDRWLLVVKTYEASSRNLINRGIDAELLVDMTDGIDVADWAVDFERATCVIAGFLENVLGEPLEQVQVMALIRGTNCTSAARPCAGPVFPSSLINM